VLYLGVHWIFDAFMVRDEGGEELVPDLKKVNEDNLLFGGVPLGLLIAEDVFNFGAGRAPKKSDVPPRM
jgi:hypothetical protein